ncbi:unnamed protein product [Heligmosomoides polygyrus]|uniref:Doublecortin domain-containing protein n=1 Tax=Heligmosomoides polygyrus TaxID=6339 RepID=A0A183GJX4_HELPZ|nr:unnamed protein product [Heligmosomoides polygyrus]
MKRRVNVIMVLVGDKTYLGNTRYDFARWPLYIRLNAFFQSTNYEALSTEEVQSKANERVVVGRTVRVHPSVMFIETSAEAGKISSEELQRKTNKLDVMFIETSADATNNVQLVCELLLLCFFILVLFSECIE